MTAFADWAAGLCAAGVACAILRLLCPEGVLNDTLRVVTALLFFCCLLSPLGMLREFLADGFSVAAASSSSVSRALDERVDKQAAAVIEDALLRDAVERLENVEVKRVEIVCVESDEAVGVTVERVRVVFAKEEHPLPVTVTATLERAWGVPVEVYYADGK